MDASYDAQRNEFRPYVLSESETPFGLTLGHFTTFASSTAKGGIRGLWDADTDQIIFGRTRSPIASASTGRVFRTKSNANSPSCRTRRSASSRSTTTSGWSRRLRPARPKHDRTVAFVVDVTVHNAGIAPATVRVFPWALLIGQRYGEPKSGTRQRRGPLHSQLRRGVGLGALVGRFARAGRDHRRRARTGDPRRNENRRAGRRAASRRGDAEARGDRQPPHLRRVRVRDRGRTRRARKFAAGRRFSQGRRRAQQTGPAATAGRRNRAARDPALLRAPALRRALDDALAADQPRRRVGQSEHAARDQRVSAGLGFDEFSASDILVSRDTSWFVHGYAHLRCNSVATQSSCSTASSSPADRWSNTSAG